MCRLIDSIGWSSEHSSSFIKLSSESLMIIWAFWGELCDLDEEWYGIGDEGKMSTEFPMNYELRSGAPTADVDEEW